MKKDVSQMTDTERMEYYYEQSSYYQALGNKLRRLSEAEFPGQIHLPMGTGEYIGSSYAVGEEETLSIEECYKRSNHYQTLGNAIRRRLSRAEYPGQLHLNLESM